MPIAEAKNKSFVCICGSFNKSDVGIKICDYAQMQMQFIPPVISKTSDNITVTPAYIRSYLIGGNVYVSGVRDQKYAIPTSVYYT